MEIRKATQADTTEIKRLLDEQHRYHVDLCPSIFRFQPLDVETVHEIIENKAKEFIIAEEGDQLIGIIQLEQQKTKHPILLEKAYSYIQEMYVAAAYRRAGIGVKLMEAAKKWAKVYGLEFLRTSVWPHNQPALSFYEKEGFNPFMISTELQID